MGVVHAVLWVPLGARLGEKGFSTAWVRRLLCNSTFEEETPSGSSQSTIMEFVLTRKAYPKRPRTNILRAPCFDSG